MIKEFRPQEVIEKTKKELKSKKEMKPPEWSLFVKTGAGRERPPEQEDWWYSRAASIMRKLYLNEPIGTNRLKSHYGNRKNRGVKPEKTYKGSGKIIRTILQQLQQTGFVEKRNDGRVLTRKGRSFLDKLISKKAPGKTEKKSSAQKTPTKNETTKKQRKQPSKKSKSQGSDKKSGQSKSKGNKKTNKK